MAALTSSSVTHVTPDIWTQLQLLVVDGGLRVVIGIVILVIGWSAATWAKRGLEAGLARIPMDLTLKPLLASLARYLILMLTLLLVIGNFGVQTTSLIAVLGAAGLAIGLALQGTLSNVASGVMLLVLRPFRVGQFVEIGGKQGTVREIGLFTTLMITRDNIYVSMPNSAIFGATIINYTRERLRRVNVLVPVDWCNDVEQVEDVLMAAMAANPMVLKDPPPSVVLQELQEYTMMMRARAHVRSPDYWKALWSLQKEIKIALDKASILPAVTRQAPVTRAEPDVPGNRKPQAAPDQPGDDRPPVP
ncbi:MAG: mechanosensitive ion channel family protein [Alphaproteobacteria bacterium]|nr:mechanosensitive ion channel family protein [Alphaproteobacteria bacterium]